jgi:chemotaxis protein MotA
MSTTTFFGLAVGIILFVGSIMMSTDNVIIFISIPSLILVFGGTLANGFMSYQGPYVIKALKSTLAIFSHAKTNETILVGEAERVVQWSRIVSTQGQVALEQHIKAKGNDALLSYGIQLVADGIDPECVRDLLTNRVETSHDREMRQVDILRNMAATAPAFGMIGTLVGLVIMLDGLTDASTLGSGLAVAMLTTLYGVLVARFIFQPAADKTQQREEVARFRNMLMMEGFVMLSEGRTTSFIQQRIASFLPPEIAVSWDAKRVSA